MGFRLRVASGLQAGRELALSSREVRIGRGATSDVVLLDAGVSRCHARIVQRGGACLVEDLGSANGTEVNGTRLGQPRVLAEGDRIRVGPVTFVFVHGDPPQGGRRAARGPRLPALERLPPRARVGACGLVLAVLLATAALRGRSLAQEEVPAASTEPPELAAAPLREAFGLGEGVRWVHADAKTFTFDLAAPTRAVALLHYRARDISPEEVRIELNGAVQGWVPPDEGPPGTRELQQVLPPSALRRGAHNTLTFRNVRNPPGQDAWRIEGLSLELIPVPALPPAELLASARGSVATARRYAEQRAVSSENLFRAWKHYRAAWVTLEALEERPELYEDVRQALAQVSSDLDRECARLLLEVQRGTQYRDARAVRAAFEEVLRRFPTPEHRCHTLALEQRRRPQP